VNFPFQLIVACGGWVFGKGFKACNIGNFISAFRQPGVVEIMDRAVGLFEVAPDGKGGKGPTLYFGKEELIGGRIFPD
jgi:hypothetical protein